MEATQQRLTLDRMLDYAASTGPARCRLRVFGDVRVAVVTELDDNPGMSVTNAAEDVATAIERELDDEVGARFHGACWRLVEHYPQRCDWPESFALVIFRGYDRDGRLKDPEWIPPPPAMAWLSAAMVS